MKFLVDLLFPKVCLGCGFLGSHICPRCYEKLKKIEKDSCFYCKRHSFLGLTHPSCSKRYGVDGNLSCFYYDNTLKKIIKNIKYRLVRDGLRELLLLIHQDRINKLGCYNKLYKKLFIEPVPLFKTRERQRGFNQAEEISRFVLTHFDFAQASNLTRTRDTFSQSQLSDKKSRKKNIKNAFTLSSKKTVTGHNIVLIDDIVTTGATVAEAASVLKKHGAGKVFVFTLAKG